MLTYIDRRAINKLKRVRKYKLNREKIPKKSRRCLLVCDAFVEKGSGAAAARVASRCLASLGFEILVYGGLGRYSSIADNDTSFNFVKQPDFRVIQHLFPGRILNEFNALFLAFDPTLVFVLGSAYSKPIGILETISRSTARTIYMPWNQDFYCAKSYGFQDSQPCEKCLSGDYSQALRENCVGRAAALSGAINRTRLKKRLQQFDRVLCSSITQRNALSRYLNRPIDDITIFPLFFDSSISDGLVSEDGDYFIYYSQAIEAKGWNLIVGILEKCPTIRFLLCPAGSREDILRRTPKLQSLLDGRRVSFVSGCSWDTGLGTLVAKSRAVLIPSVWPTTTEYVLLEALSLGKPVVAFDIGVHHDVLSNRKNAMLVQRGDIDAYSDAIIEIDQISELRANISDGAKVAFTSLVDIELSMNILAEVCGA